MQNTATDEDARTDAERKQRPYEDENGLGDEPESGTGTPPSPRSSASQEPPVSPARADASTKKQRNSLLAKEILDRSAEEAIASARAATLGFTADASGDAKTAEEAEGAARRAERSANTIPDASGTAEDNSIDMYSTDGIDHAQLLSELVELKPEAAAALDTGSDSPRVSLALLLEASAAAAEAEKKAAKRELDPSAVQKLVENRAEADKYITEAIHRVQTTPRNERSMELRPVDRREQKVSADWSRYDEIQNDAQLLRECRRLVRGTQGCGRECEAKFTNLVDFAKHVDEIHDVNFRPFLCPKSQCPWAIIGFHERSECTRHIRTKHFKAMYCCEFQGCTKVYNRSDAFRRHVRQAHANPGSRFNRVLQRSGDTK